MTIETTARASDAEIAKLVEELEEQPGAGSDRLGHLLRNFPADPRLLFLNGSLKAAAGETGEARRSMRRAIDVAPDFAIARFQLGLLQLTCAEPIAAQETWGPLHALPEDAYLRVMVSGLVRMIQDDADGAIRLLRRGIALNRENAVLNGDMELVIEQLLRPRDGDDAGWGGAVTSSAALLLRQASLRTRH